MRRYHLSLIFVTAVSLLVFAMGCENETNQNDLAVEVPWNVNKTVDQCGFWESGWIDQHTDSSDWEVFTGTVYPGNFGGGLLVAYPTTWIGGSNFVIQVPGGALPADADPVQFELHVLRRDAIEDLQAVCGDSIPVIMRLEPSGVAFLEDITIRGTYMPWIATTLEDLPIEHDAYYCVSSDCDNHEYTMPQNAVYESRRMVRFTFDVPHFSDWNMGGSGGEGDIPDK